MIRADDAIRAARALLGTPYGELDCINLIKRVIRTAPGGVPGYKTAGTNTLWRSAESAAKYRDLTWRQEGLAGAKAGMLAFKRSGDDVHHVGLVTGEGTVIHSSSAKGCVVETELGGTWQLLARHRYIGVENPSASLRSATFGVKPPLSSASGGEEASRPLSGEASSASHGSPERGARAAAPSGRSKPSERRRSGERSETEGSPPAGDVYIVCAEGGLRMRERPSAKGKYMQMIPDGTRVTALDERAGWIRCEYRGHVGWVSGAYCCLATGND